MEDSDELKQLLIKKDELEDELKKVDTKIMAIVNLMSFNISNITNILASLITNNEGETYTPLFLDDKNNQVTNKLSFLIVRANSLDDAYHRHHVDKTIDIGSVIYKQYGKIGKHTFNPYKTNITFRYLLDKNGINIAQNKNMLCEYNFNDYPYVYEFLDYLFLLQLENNKQLTSSEMEIAMNDFIKGKNNFKTRIKKKDLSI